MDIYFFLQRPTFLLSAVDFSTIEDSYTSLFAPCDLTFYAEGKGREDDADNDRRALRVHAYPCESLDATAVISSESIEVFFWPDAAVGDGPRCYSASDIPTLEDDSLAKWEEFVHSLEDYIYDASVDTTSISLNVTEKIRADLSTISQNATKKIRAEFATIPSKAAHVMVNCNADKVMAKEIESDAEMAIYVGGAAVLALLVCFFACFGTFIWCCCCKDKKKKKTHQGEYAPVAATRVDTGLSPVETGLAPPVGPSPSAPKYEASYGSTATAR